MGVGSRNGDPNGDRMVRMDRMGVEDRMDPNGDRMDRMDRMGVEDRMDPNGERVDRAGVDLDGDVLRDLGDPIHLTMGGILYTYIYIYIYTLHIKNRMHIRGDFLLDSCVTHRDTTFCVHYRVWAIVCC